MHRLVKDRLEELLADGGARPDNSDVSAHLAECLTCRQVVDAMRVNSIILKSLRPAEALEPRAGFYARVVDRIEAQRKPSFWAAFLEPGFARRLVYAALVCLVLFGGYLVSTEQPVQAVASGPEVIMADAEQALPVVGADPQQDRDAILVTLTTFQE